MAKITTLFLFVICMHTVAAQEVVTTIPLDNSLKWVGEIMQFSNNQGNVLLKFRGNTTSQYSLLQANEVIKNQTLNIGERYNFLECLYDDNNFSLFYQDQRKETINVFQIGSKIAAQLSESNIPNNEEKHLTSGYHQGDFLVFKYSRSPFTLHTYTYRDGEYFEKKSQVFQNQKSEQFFLGQISTENEIIFVRLTFRKPFPFHFYRYKKGKGFEKKSIDIRPLYEKAGFETKVFPADLSFSLLQNLSAFIEGETIYLDMENLISINPSFSRVVNLRQHPGILRFDWTTETGEIISFDKENRTDYMNRSSALIDSFYLKLLVNKNYLDLSIFDVSNQQLRQQYTYDKEQQIDLIYENANLNKTRAITFNLSYLIDLPVNINRPKNEVIDTKTLLKNLSRGELFMDAFSNDDIIEIDVTGVNEETLLLDIISTASFTSYLSKSDLSVVKKFDDLEDKRYTKIEEYVSQLTETNKNIGQLIIYTHQENIYLAYIDEKERHCKIVLF